MCKQLITVLGKMFIRGSREVSKSGSRKVKTNAPYQFGGLFSKMMKVEKVKTFLCVLTNLFDMLYTNDMV